jgi:DNA glycosylase AlkZ-like
LRARPPGEPLLVMLSEAPADSPLRLGLGQGGSFVLRHLWAEGAVHRFPSNRQLDSNRHSYRLPAKRSQLQHGAADAMREMARRFFRWAAPATLKEFAWWAGSSQKDGRDGMEGLKLRPVDVTGWSDDAWGAIGFACPARRRSPRAPLHLSSFPRQLFILPARPRALPRSPGAET